MSDDDFDDLDGLSLTQDDIDQNIAVLQLINDQISWLIDNNKPYKTTQYIYEGLARELEDLGYVTPEGCTSYYPFVPNVLDPEAA